MKKRKKTSMDQSTNPYPPWTFNIKMTKEEIKWPSIKSRNYKYCIICQSNKPFGKQRKLPISYKFCPYCGGWTLNFVKFLKIGK